MFDTSPIESWEGAGAFFNSAGSWGVTVWLIIVVVLCVIPIISSIRPENKIEKSNN